MRVLVCGGRDFDDYPKLDQELNYLFPLRSGPPADTVVIHGGARGADELACLWAANNLLETEPFHADWKKHGRAAGPIRNQQMLDEGKPDLVVAFPGGRGTADMVRRAKAAGVRVIEVI